MRQKSPFVYAVGITHVCGHSVAWNNQLQTGLQFAAVDISQMATM